MGDQFVKLLVKEDYARAVGEFDLTMKKALSEQKLADIWHTLQEQVGTFKKETGTRVEATRNFQMVFVTCQFERAGLDVKVVSMRITKWRAYFSFPRR